MTGSPPHIPDYDLHRPIGSGGFGTVWLAVNSTTGRPCAVKVIPLDHGGGAGREIVSLAKLEARAGRRRPHLMPIHHVGKTPAHLYYVMDLADDIRGGTYVSGAQYRPATLASRLEAGALPAEPCRGFALQLLEALAALHEAGMVHRDVKPSNCLIVGGELMLADFGLLTDQRADVSRVGTEKYMPRDGRMDARADVYAAGLVIYEMLTGLPVDRFPHTGERGAAIAHDPVLSGLFQAVLGACEPDSARRYPDAQGMRSAMEALVNRRVPARSARRRLLAAAIVAAAFGLGALGYWWTMLRTVRVTFITAPRFEARVFLDGIAATDATGAPALTPCTLDHLPPRPHRVTFRLEGMPELDAGMVDFAVIRQITARWEGD